MFFRFRNISKELEKHYNSDWSNMLLKEIRNELLKRGSGVG
jgi:hypothetical protein